MSMPVIWDAIVLMYVGVYGGYEHFKCTPLTKAELPYLCRICYFMSVSNKVSYLIVSIMLLSQDRIIIIFTVKFEINNIAFTLKDSFEGQSNWKMNWITPSDYAMHLCTFHFLCLYDTVIFLRTLSRTIKQIFSFLRHFFCEISDFKFDAYRVILTGASDLKHFVGGIYRTSTAQMTYHNRYKAVSMHFGLYTLHFQ